MRLQYRLALFAWLLVPTTLHADCYEGCGKVLEHPVFTTETVMTGNAYKSSFKSLLCSAQWKSASEAQSAGLSATIPIYDIPVPFTANWNTGKREAWQSRNCSAEERNVDYGSQLYRTAYAVDSVTATSWLQCVKDTCTPKALRCSLTEAGSSIVFEATWKRGEGEADSAAPTVKSFVTNNTTCSNGTLLATGQKVTDGGIALLCSQNLEKAPSFVLVTDRGSCMQATDLSAHAQVLSGTISLDRPTTYQSSRLSLSGDLKIITNGYPLSMIADTLVIEGSPQVVSFLHRDMEPGEAGRSAATVTIKAKRVQGAGLSVANFGEDGAKGRTGLPGPQGPQGGPGSSRQWGPRHGCGPGSNGGTGGQGGVGSPGGRGGAGGAAGEVILTSQLGSGGPGSSVQVLLYPPGSTRDCGGFRTCGGLGGSGGDGGPGGAGGPGGPGASGTKLCGGTSPGAPGPPGAKGPSGEDGSPGASAAIKIF